ncbi:hypothetical protein ACFQ4K_00035 [Tistrella bauzanensis]
MKRDDGGMQAAGDLAGHPRTAAVLVGHQAAEQAFLDAWNGGRLPHAWMITGPKGLGKATLAYRVARFVLAVSGDAAAAEAGQPCSVLPATMTAGRRQRWISRPRIQPRAGWRPAVIPICWCWNAALTIAAGRGPRLPWARRGR